MCHMTFLHMEHENGKIILLFKTNFVVVESKVIVAAVLPCCC